MMPFFIALQFLTTFPIQLESHAEQTAKMVNLCCFILWWIDHWWHTGADRVYTTKPGDYSAQQYYFGCLDLADRVVCI